MRALQQLVDDRCKLADDRVRLTNRITSALKEYLPSPVGCALATGRRFLLSER